MTYKNIASILNTQIIQNMLGQTVTVAEDLSNIDLTGYGFRWLARKETDVIASPSPERRCVFR